MADLENYYRGDEAWRRFAQNFHGELEKCPFAEELKSLLGGDEDIANVVYGSVGADALRLISAPVPALSGLSPRECLASPTTINRLRECLQRMPR
jgi:hypothetical protein